MKNFSNRLISLRKEHGLTQEDVGQIVNKTRSTISGYETEGKEPSLETICLLAKYFNVSTDYLLGYSDERNHVETVFYNDKINFEQHFKSLSEELRPIIAKCFNNFYLLLDCDIQFNYSDRIQIYDELLYTLQSLRNNIRKVIESFDGTVTDPIALSDLINTQNQLKNEISSLLDKLMQADMEIAFNIKKDVNNELLKKLAT